MMAELWQSYGSWVLYGIFFALMLLMHGRMHGEHGSHAGNREAAGRDPAAGHSREDPARPAHNHRRGCC